VEKDSREYTVKIQVTDDGTGKLKVERIDEEGALNFTNKYNVNGNITLGGKKFIDKRDFAEGDSATMKIEAITENAPMPDPSEVTVEPTEGTSIDYVFGTINYKLSDLPEGAGSSKTFEYKVTESAYDMDGVTKDSTEYTVSVTVTARAIRPKTSAAMAAFLLM
jgi:pilin isopeptide linkage protein